MSPRNQVLILTTAQLLLAVIAPAARAQGSGEAARLWRPAATARASAAPARDTARPADRRVRELSLLVDSLRRVAERPAVVESVTVPARAVELPAVFVARLDSLESANRALTRQIATVQQNLIQRVAGLGNFRFAGDVRLRYEPTFQDGGTVTRQRERSRARLHLTGSPSGQFSGGISVTTGAVDEPQSENQTLSGFFTRKSIAFERFYVTYKPRWFRAFSVTAGKFPMPWQRTTLTFSPDIHPEGISQSLKYAFARGPLAEAAVVSFALPLLEVANAKDTYLMGGQFQTRWRFGSRASFRAVGAMIDVRRADAIAVAVAGSAFKPAQPASNRLRTDSTGKVLGYASRFAYQDVQASLDYAFSARWPVTLSANVVRNPHAAAGERRAWQVEARAGDLSAARRAQFTYTRYRIERDAVLGAFNDTDLRAATNVNGHRFQAAWKLQGDLTATFAATVGRLDSPAATPSLAAPHFKDACRTGVGVCRDPWMTRLQFDLLYTF